MTSNMGVLIVIATVPDENLAVKILSHCYNRNRCVKALKGFRCPHHWKRVVEKSAGITLIIIRTTFGNREFATDDRRLPTYDRREGLAISFENNFPRHKKWISNETSLRIACRYRQMLRGVAQTLFIFMTLAGANVGPAYAAKAGEEPELLEAEKAFKVTARLIGNNAVELRYTIANDYYMYRDRFHFLINAQPVSLAKKTWPAGKWKQDATFGKVVTYRKSVRLLLPLTIVNVAAIDSSRESLTVVASSQGCADAGVCYPPLRHTLVLQQGSHAWIIPRDEVVSGFSRDRSPGSGLIDRLSNGK